MRGEGKEGRVEDGVEEEREKEGREEVGKARRSPESRPIQNVWRASIEQLMVKEGEGAEEEEEGEEVEGEEEKEERVFRGERERGLRGERLVGGGGERDRGGGEREIGREVGGGEECILVREKGEGGFGRLEM